MSVDVEKAPKESVDDLWNDPSEKRNPANWGLFKKIFHTAVPCFLAFLIVFGTSITVPATPLLMKEFNITRTVALLPLTLYTIGLAFGPLFFAPLSEFWGRRWVFISTMTCLLAFEAGAGAANNFATLLICRFFAGFLGSAGVAMGGGTISDIWSLEKGGVPALMFILGPFLGPSMAPIAGSYILDAPGRSWRWTQWVVLMVGAPIYVMLLLTNETAKHQLIKRYKSAKDTQDATKNPPIFEVLWTAITRPIRMLFLEPAVLSLTLYTAYAYAVIFSFFASASYVLPLYYHFNLRQVGLSFISVIIGFVLASFMFGVFDKTLYARAAKANNGHAPPEQRLYSALVGSIFLPVGLFWYAWEAHRGGNWAALVAAGIPFGFGSFSLFLSTITYLVETYRARAAASALAANGALRYTLGATFPLFTFQMYERLGIHWAGSIFAFLSLLLLPIPWLLFFKYGKILREKSHFDTSTL